MSNSFCGNMHVVRQLLCQFCKHQYCTYLYPTALYLNALHSPDRYHFNALSVFQENLSLIHTISKIPFLSPLTHALHLVSTFQLPFLSASWLTAPEALLDIVYHIFLTHLHHFGARLLESSPYKAGQIISPTNCRQNPGSTCC